MTPAQMIFVINGQMTIAFHATEQLVFFQDSQHFLAFGFSRYVRLINSFRQHFRDELQQGFFQVLL